MSASNPSDGDAIITIRSSSRETLTTQNQSQSHQNESQNNESSSWYKIKTEIGLLLHFSMLAACTIGPGTVVTCSKSGADFGLQLTWALVLGSFVAYILQEGSARLSIVSGSGLGQAMRFHLGAEVGHIPIICAVVAIGILVGNSAYEANNFVGSNAALFSLHLPEETGYRILGSFGLGFSCIAVLVFGSVDSISKALGIVVVAMVCLFGANLFQVGFTAKNLGEGLLPNFPSNGGGVTALSMVSTTAIPFNCFLASAAAEGYTMQEMRRGIGCSTALAGFLSFFILVSGTGIESKDNDFAVGDVTDELRKTEGDAAGVLFGIGLFAAAFSSALSVALGSSITCQSLLAHARSSDTKASETPSTSSSTQPVQKDKSSRLEINREINVQNPLTESIESKISSTTKNTEKEATTAAVHHEEKDGVLQDITDSISPQDDSGLHVKEVGDHTHSEFGRWSDEGLYFRLILIAIVMVGIIVGSSGANTVDVIITAQVVNGLLLPVIATCLLVCLNDEQLMDSRPITTLDNFLLVITVAATIFLSSHTIIGAIITDVESDILIGSAVTMFVLLIPIMYYVISLLLKKRQKDALLNERRVVSDSESRPLNTPEV